MLRHSPSTYGQGLRDLPDSLPRLDSVELARVLRSCHESTGQHSRRLNRSQSLLNHWRTSVFTRPRILKWSGVVFDVLETGFGKVSVQRLSADLRICLCTEMRTPLWMVGICKPPPVLKLLKCSKRHSTGAIGLAVVHSAASLRLRRAEGSGRRVDGRSKCASVAPIVDSASKKLRTRPRGTWRTPHCTKRAELSSYCSTLAFHFHCNYWSRLLGPRTPLLHHCVMPITLFTSI